MHPTEDTQLESWWGYLVVKKCADCSADRHHKCDRCTDSVSHCSERNSKTLLTSDQCFSDGADNISLNYKKCQTFNLKIPKSWMLWSTDRHPVKVCISWTRLTAVDALTWQTLTSQLLLQLMKCLSLYTILQTQHNMKKKEDYETRFIKPL